LVRLVTTQAQAWKENEDGKVSEEGRCREKKRGDATYLIDILEIELSRRLGGENSRSSEEGDSRSELLSLESICERKRRYQRRAWTRRMEESQLTVERTEEGSTSLKSKNLVGSLPSDLNGEVGVHGGESRV